MIAGYGYSIDWHEGLRRYVVLSSSGRVVFEAASYDACVRWIEGRS